MRKLLRHGLAVGLMLGAGAACWSCSHGAPAPMRRAEAKARPHVEEGRWLLHWGEARYVVTLSRDGGYHAVNAADPQDEWVGLWSWGRRTRTLTISERPAPWGEWWPAWVIKLDDNLAGEIPNKGQAEALKVKMVRVRDN